MCVSERQRADPNSGVRLRKERFWTLLVFRSIRNEFDGTHVILIRTLYNVYSYQVLVLVV
jgi:hypothetical protein